MKRFQLAQINIARFVHPKDASINAEFMAALDPVNAKAELAPGFVWRLIGDDNDATDIVVDNDPRLIVNLSVWDDMEALSNFVYRQSDHLAIMRRRKEWFEKIDVFMALWWVPAGHIPNLAEGMEKIAWIASRGATAQAFSFREPFDAPDETSETSTFEKCA